MTVSQLINSLLELTIEDRMLQVETYDNNLDEYKGLVRVEVVNDDKGKKSIDLLFE